VSKHRSYVLYGRSGTGKTTIAASFPKPLLLLDAKDKGTDSISDVKKIDVMDVKAYEDFETVYWFLKQNPEAYKTVVIDTMSQVQHLAIEQIMEDQDKDTKRAGEWGTMTKRDWGMVASKLKEAIINFRDLPQEVVFIAQDRVFNDDEGDEESMLDPEVGPGLIPSVVKTLNAAVTVIGNTFIRNRIKVTGKGRKRKETKRTQYCLRVGPNPVYITKMRKPKKVKLPSVLVNPTYEDLIEIIKGE